MSKIEVTFSNGRTVTRRTDRPYTHAWIVRVPYYAWNRETGEYTDQIEWTEHHGFALSLKGAQQSVRMMQPKHHRARNFRPTKQQKARKQFLIDAYNRDGWHEIALVMDWTFLDAPGNDDLN